MTSPLTPLSELASRFPAASRVFHRHRLDYCCGGRRPLAEACAERGLDAEAILAEIVAQPADDDVPLAERSSVSLVEHIVARYHEPLRAELPRLVAMARKVERVHGERPGCPLGLDDHLTVWMRDVIEHLDMEEHTLFPALRSGGPASPEIMAALSREHDDSAAVMRRTRELTTDLVAPPHACTTWRALYIGLEQLERDLMEHVHIENHVLFPRAMQPRAMQPRAMQPRATTTTPETRHDAASPAATR